MIGSFFDAQVNDMILWCDYYSFITEPYLKYLFILLFSSVAVCLLTSQQHLKNMTRFGTDFAVEGLAYEKMHIF